MKISLLPKCAAFLLSRVVIHKLFPPDTGNHNFFTMDLFCATTRRKKTKSIFDVYAKSQLSTKLLLSFGVEETKFLRLFETCRAFWISLFLMRRLRKLILFWARVGLRMKLTAMKELIFLFQMAPNRILCDR